MSLTTFIAKPDVREKFSSEFEKPKFQVKKEIVASPLTKNYSLVGTAFDYLLRCHLEYLNSPFIEHRYGWIAELSLPLLSGTYREKAVAIIGEAKKNWNHFLETGQHDDELLKSALLLAGLDPIFRAKRGQEYIGLVDNQDVQDLRNLISAVDMQIFKAQKSLILNPSFGKASQMVGGADADLIIDDMLVDIKTTISLELPKEHFHQLIGYLTLYYLNGAIERKESLPEINKLAIYFSRYSYLHVIQVENIASHEKFAQFGKWFVERAKIDSNTRKT